MESWSLIQTADFLSIQRVRNSGSRSWPSEGIYLRKMGMWRSECPFKDEQTGFAKASFGRTNAGAAD